MCGSLQSVQGADSSKNLKLVDKDIGEALLGCDAEKSLSQPRGDSGKDMAWAALLTAQCPEGPASELVWRGFGMLRQWFSCVRVFGCSSSSRYNPTVD